MKPIEDYEVVVPMWATCKIELRTKQDVFNAAKMADEKISRLKLYVRENKLFKNEFDFSFNDEEIIIRKLGDLENGS